MIHPNEPSTEALKTLRRDLVSAESTDANMKKLCAINAQITRREEEAE